MNEDRSWRGRRNLIGETLLSKDELQLKPAAVLKSLHVHGGITLLQFSKLL